MAGNGVNFGAAVAVAIGVTRRNGTLGAAVVAGILGDAAGAICLGVAVGLAKGARAGKAVGEANAGVGIG